MINKKATILLSIWVLLLFIGVAGVAYINIQTVNTLNDSIYYYKVMNAPTRSMDKVTEDTAYIKRLELEYQKMIK